MRLCVYVRSQILPVGRFRLHVAASLCSTPGVLRATIYNWLPAKTLITDIVFGNCAQSHRGFLQVCQSSRHPEIAGKRRFSTGLLAAVREGATMVDHKDHAATG